MTLDQEIQWRGATDRTVKHSRDVPNEPYLRAIPGIMLWDRVARHPSARKIV
jgi:hypothetical protein